MKFTVDQIAALIGGEVEGDGNATVHTISPIEKAESGSISFLSNPKYDSFIFTTNASAVIVNKDKSFEKKPSVTLIKVEDSYISFTALLEEYQKIKSFQKTGIEQPSFIHDSARLGENVYIGAFVYLGSKVEIGNNCKIHPHSYIGDNVKIGDNTIIHAGVRIYSDCIIGNHCVIHSGAIIGSDGFGFAPQDDGSYKSIPQVGNVILEDHVSIGSNAVIDCATFESTVIKKGVKIDNLVQIAHNVKVDEHTVIAAQSGIAGSTTIGKNVVIGGQVGIVGHIQIADKTKIQAQSGVNKANKEGGYLYGTPAFEYSKFVRSYTIFRKLPEVLKKVEELEKKIISLTESANS